ncbi:MAG TPA: ABC transporter permease [Blastocatellia bacterium]|jgi:predicted permease|nr:ABC transporter permease [Blastocatellia bacterium]
MLRKLFHRLRAGLRRRNIEREMDRELQFHLEMETAENIRRGMSEEEARRAAMLSFGGVERTKEDYRDIARFRRLEELWKDAQYGARMLLKTPGFTAAAALTLALGVGANTAVFSVVYATLLKPLPYPEAERIYGVEVTIPERSLSFAGRIQDYLEWRKSATAFSAVAALQQGGWNLTGNGEPEGIGGARVSANFFDFLGVPPALGRGFVPEEETPGADRVVVISDALWRRRYAADPKLVGRTIELNGQEHVVVGIASPSLLVPTGTQLHSTLLFSPRIDIWKPIAPTKAELEGEDFNTGLLLRLKANESAENGRRQLEGFYRDYVRAVAPDMKISILPRLIPIREVYSGKFRLRLLLVFAASTILLLTACVTLANLLLARFAARAGEFSIRTALGAGRIRLLAQTMTEVTTLALTGGMVGIAGAYSTAGLLAAYDPAAEKLLGGSPLNLPVLLFAMAVAMLTGFVCGAIPAWRASRAEASQVLKEGGGSVSGRKAARFQFALVSVQIALGTALLASAGLLLHSFVRLSRVDRGYDVERTMALNIGLPGNGHEQRVEFIRRLTENIRGLPGVEAVGAVSDLPALGVSGSQTIFYQTDTDLQSVVMQRPFAGQRSATPGYFAASLTALKAGRFFTEQDQTPVAVISESLARRLWPNDSLTSVVGRAIREGDVTAPLTVIVGVVEDIRPGSAEREPLPQLYRPHHQRNSGGMNVVVRTSMAPAALASAIRSEVRKLAPNLPIPNMRTMKEIVSASIAQRRFEMLLTTAFAVVAILLGVIGVYGVVSLSVANRTREIGLRMALGASPPAVMRWAFARGLRPVFIGASVGLLGAVAIATSLRSLLFAVEPTDPLSLAAVALILLGASLLACYLPARRAAELNPADLLRN